MYGSLRLRTTSVRILLDNFISGLEGPRNFRHSEVISLQFFSELHGSFCQRQFSANPVYASSIPPPPLSANFEKRILYRGRGIRLFRVLVRLKIFQLSGIAALAVPITTFLSHGDISPYQSVIAAALVTGSAAASTALWYFSRRYVGELALLIPTGEMQLKETRSPGQLPRVRFSVLDFWGNRENADFDVEDIVPPLEGLSPAAATMAASEPALPVHAIGDRKFILSLRYGHVIDGATLRALLEGQKHDLNALIAKEKS